MAARDDLINLTQGTVEERPGRIVPKRIGHLMADLGVIDGETQNLLIEIQDELVQAAGMKLPEGAAMPEGIPEDARQIRDPDVARSILGIKAHFGAQPPPGEDQAGKTITGGHFNANVQVPQVGDLAENLGFVSTRAKQAVLSVQAVSRATGVYAHLEEMAKPGWQSTEADQKAAEKGLTDLVLNPNAEKRAQGARARDWIGKSGSESLNLIGAQATHHLAEIMERMVQMDPTLLQDDDVKASMQALRARSGKNLEIAGKQLAGTPAAAAIGQFGEAFADIDPATSQDSPIIGLHKAAKKLRGQGKIEPELYSEMTKLFVERTGQADRVMAPDAWTETDKFDDALDRRWQEDRRKAEAQNKALLKLEAEAMRPPPEQAEAEALGYLKELYGAAGKACPELQGDPKKLKGQDGEDAFYFQRGLKALSALEAAATPSAPDTTGGDPAFDGKDALKAVQEGYQHLLQHAQMKGAFPNDFYGEAEQAARMSVDTLRPLELRRKAAEEQGRGRATIRSEADAPDYDGAAAAPAGLSAVSKPFLLEKERGGPISDISYADDDSAVRVTFKSGAKLNVAADASQAIFEPKPRAFHGRSPVDAEVDSMVRSFAELNPGKAIAIEGEKGFCEKAWLAAKANGVAIDDSGDGFKPEPGSALHRRGQDLEWLHKMRTGQEFQPGDYVPTHKNSKVVREYNAWAAENDRDPYVVPSERKSKPINRLISAAAVADASRPAAVS